MGVGGTIGMGWGVFFVLVVFLVFLESRKEEFRLRLVVTETWQQENEEIELAKLREKNSGRKDGKKACSPKRADGCCY